MSIKFICPKCRKEFTVKDEQSGVRAKCPCGAIFTIPLEKPITNENIVAVEGRKNSISGSFLAVLTISGLIIWCISFICGAFLNKPDYDKIASQIKQIESDTSQVKSETEQLKKLIIKFEKTNVSIVCNKFKLVTKVTDSTLVLSVNTDLLSDTVVIVSVSRSYWKRGSQDEYSVDYFSEKSTIEKWRSNQKVSIASEQWKSALRAKQEKMSKLGLGFDVARISDKINVHMVVPTNQANPHFGKDNSKLTGSAVMTTGLRVIKDDVEINYPLENQILDYRSNIPQVDTKQKRKVYGIDFSKLYFQLDGSFKQIKEMAAQLKYRMEADRSWTTDDLLDQFSYESGFSVSKLKEVMDSTIVDGKNINQNWNEYEALLLAGLFLENERHAATKY